MPIANRFRPCRAARVVFRHRFQKMKKTIRGSRGLLMAVFLLYFFIFYFEIRTFAPLLKKPSLINLVK